MGSTIHATVQGVTAKIIVAKLVFLLSCQGNAKTLSIVLIMCNCFQW